MQSLMDLLTTARHYVDLPTFLVTTCVGLLAYLYLHRHKNLPPGPRGWPLLGNTPMLAKSTFVPATITELSKQYGDVMTIWLGREMAIVISGYQTIRNVLIKRADEFSNRKDIPIITDIRGDGKSTSTLGLVQADYGPQWKQQRKFTLMTLRDFGVGKRSLEGKISEEANALIQEVASKHEQPFDIQIMLQNTLSNIICSIVFGQRFEYGDPEFLRLNDLMTSVMDARPTRDILPQIHPIFRHLKFGSRQQRKMANAMRGIQVFCGEQIQKHRETFDPNDIRDFTDAFLLEQQQTQDEKAKANFTDKQLQELLVDLFVAGTETTATTIRWGLLYMVLNPGVQEKVHEEIESVLGQAPPSFAHRDKMPYTTATIAEIQRTSTIAPFAMPHAASQDTTLNGFTIPADVRLLINLWSVHMDPQLFPEPHKFNPDRFLDQDGNFVRHEAVIPFSLGHRACLGEQLARMELFLLFVSLMQRFSFRLPGGAPVPSTIGIYGSVVSVPRPFDLCACPYQ